MANINNLIVHEAVEAIVNRLGFVNSEAVEAFLDGYWESIAFHLNSGRAVDLAEYGILYLHQGEILCLSKNDLADLGIDQVQIAHLRKILRSPKRGRVDPKLLRETVRQIKNERVSG